MPAVLCQVLTSNLCQRLPQTQACKTQGPTPSGESDQEMIGKLTIFQPQHFVLCFKVAVLGCNHPLDAVRPHLPPEVRQPLVREAPFFLARRGRFFLLMVVIILFKLSSFCGRFHHCFEP